MFRILSPLFFWVALTDLGRYEHLCSGGFQKKTPCQIVAFILRNPSVIPQCNPPGRREMGALTESRYRVPFPLGSEHRPMLSTGGSGRHLIGLSQKVPNCQKVPPLTHRSIVTRTILQPISFPGRKRG